MRGKTGIQEYVEFEKLRNNLKNALYNYQNKPRYKHYHCNEIIISCFREKIRNEKDPLEVDIMSFVTCLESFYSAGLKFENDKSGIEKMTVFLKNNWTSGLKISEQINYKVNPDYIKIFKEKFRNESKFKRNIYSFITKFYHQFNSDYPIYDSKLEKLLNLVLPDNKKTINKTYSTYYKVYIDFLNKLNCEMSIDEFDNAAWILIKEKEEGLKEQEKKEELKKGEKKLTLEYLLKELPLYNNSL